jgi:hypothetical protein
MNVNSRGHNLDTRFERFFLEIKHPLEVKLPVGVTPQKWYCLQSDVLDHLLKPEGSPTPWINWAPLFRALERLWIGVIDPKRQNLDPLTQASELRRIGKEMRPLLADAGWGRQLEDDSSFRGVEYSAVFTRNIKGILSQLNQ